MNRHERRKARAEERRARRKPGQAPPNAIAVLATKGMGKDLPPEYFEAVRKLAKATYDWIQAHPGAKLKWIERKQDGVILTGSLDVCAHYLADSPDALALIAEVDAQTGRVCSLFQMLWALRTIRALPMPDGSYYGVETTRKTWASERMEHFAASIRKGPPEHRTPVSPCGHCKAPLDCADSPDGKGPLPGNLSICICCAGFNQYQQDLTVVGKTDEEIEALTGSQWPDMRDLRDSIRGALARMTADKMGKTAVVEA